jgi:hypothetical protein
VSLISNPTFNKFKSRRSRTRPSIFKAVGPADDSPEQARRSPRRPGANRPTNHSRPVGAAESAPYFGSPAKHGFANELGFAFSIPKVRPCFNPRFLLLHVFQHAIRNCAVLKDATLEADQIKYRGPDTQFREADVNRRDAKDPRPIL